VAAALVETALSKTKIKTSMLAEVYLDLIA